VLSCESFFLFFSWLVASLCMDSERPLLLTGYGILWVSFGVPWCSFFRVSQSPFGYRDVNNPPSCSIFHDCMNISVRTAAYLLFWKPWLSTLLKIIIPFLTLDLFYAILPKLMFSYQQERL
jgi:hypothetical protein